MADRSALALRDVSDPPGNHGCAARIQRTDMPPGEMAVRMRVLARGRQLRVGDIRAESTSASVLDRRAGGAAGTGPINAAIMFAGVCARATSAGQSKPRRIKAARTCSMSQSHSFPTQEIAPCQIRPAGCARPQSRPAVSPNGFSSAFTPVLTRLKKVSREWMGRLSGNSRTQPVHPAGAAAISDATVPTADAGRRRSAGKR